MTYDTFFAKNNNNQTSDGIGRYSVDEEL